MSIIEGRREQYKKKFALKFQFVINNYGFMHSRLEPASLQQLFGLLADEDPAEVSIVG